jgi:hypothetical protein
METININKTEIIEREKLINLFFSFLKDIGIEVKEAIIANDTFLPGLEIRRGILIIDKEKLNYPGDMLHEAGHIAVTIETERALLDGNVTMQKPEKQGEELAAMLWSYAACIKMGISAEIVFHKDGYKGDSEWILNNYKEKTFIGLPLLVWMGMTSTTENGFPNMLKWLRD